QAEVGVGFAVAEAVIGVGGKLVVWPAQQGLAGGHVLGVGVGVGQTHAPVVGQPPVGREFHALHAGRVDVLVLVGDEIVVDQIENVIVKIGGIEDQAVALEQRFLDADILALAFFGAQAGRAEFRKKLIQRGLLE